MHFRLGIRMLSLRGFPGLIGLALILNPKLRLANSAHSSISIAKNKSPPT